MNSKLAWACALSTFILAGKAHAQATPPLPYPQQYLAHISIQASPATELEVVPSDAASAPAVAHCTEYCDFWAWPGKYTLYAKDHISGERKELSLRFKQSSRFMLQPGDEGARTTGLALGISGSVAIIASVVLLASEVGVSGCDHDCSGSASVGLGLLLAGVVATPIGWSMYAHNRTRLKRIDERSYGATESPSPLRVGVVGLGLGGLGLGIAARF